MRTIGQIQKQNEVGETCKKTLGVRAIALHLLFFFFFFFLKFHLWQRNVSQQYLTSHWLNSETTNTETDL